ncbi:hypothetical protein J2802_002193 [Paraburkholderia caribensis]|nr:hypothetical protein [Paraburkholderia caribensis]
MGYFGEFSLVCVLLAKVGPAVHRPPV